MRSSQSTFDEFINAHQKVFSDLADQGPYVSLAAEIIAKCIGDEGGKVLLCGNGGSAADCQHFAAEFVGRFMNDRVPLPAISLTTDSSILTCVANDYDFSSVFSRQVIAIGRRNDVLIAISTSGQSENVVKALQVARQLGLITIGLLGRTGGECTALCDVEIRVNSTSTARIQEAHIFLLHALCSLVEAELRL